MSKKKQNRYKYRKAPSTTLPRKPELSQESYKYTDIISVSLLGLIIIIAYANGLNNVFLSDDFGILQNKNLGTLKDITDNPFHFVRPLFFTIAVKIGGVAPVTFRMINVLLHIGAVTTLYYILKSQLNRNVAFLAGLLVAVHPIFVESVTWISGGGYVQYSFFFLLSLYLYINSQKRVAHLIISYLFFFFSLASSIAAASLAPLFLVYEFVFGSLRKNWMRTIPYIFLSGVYAFIVLTSALSSRQEALAQTSYQQIVPINLFIKIPVAISNYIQLIVWPQNLTLYHSEFTISGIGLVIHSAIFILSLLVLLYLFIKEKKLFFWGSIFFVGLLPTLLSPGVAWIVAERYAYLSTVGVLVVVAYYCSELLQNRKINIIAGVLIALVVLGLITRTIMRNIDWKNEDNLWIATGKTSPSDPKTHNNLGDVYTRQGDYNRAAEEFSRAIELNPNYADAYHNLGNVYQQVGSPAAALELYNHAYEINPNLWQSLQQISIIYFQHQEFNRALEYMNKALQVSPNNPLLHNNLGIMYGQTGDIDNARISFNNALKLEPTNQFALQALQELDSSATP
ncbi:MAG: tetratricopeptide repeat protein [bacterium]|nr:tetratricopeptide repeat protein [bacterium]